MRTDRGGRVARSFPFVLLAALAACAALLVPVDHASSAKGEIWNGKWDTNAGTVRFFQDGDEVEGWWDCNCNDGRKAVIHDGLSVANKDGDSDGELLFGRFKCHNGTLKGIFAVTSKRNGTRFKGHWRLIGEDQERWVGEKE